ncbi:carboxylesterase/lipase family protein [Paludisphaera mucosa]|uniref:Carboxylic ester hydrolase n=1 Tax=Paludisphaera mucosa TaxID=3030827 RepID=A0ABT6FBE0_9BACT|nr:carboxylesterase family protein [Paludisphaera mucosa]MDG3004908.1 carboxylesterase family protein [Paludisphaera mucosa]
MRRDEMRVLAWATAAALMVAGTSRGVVADDKVETKAGVVEGTKAANGVRAFLGIPFAEPPVGDLRWRAPRPVRRWEGVREARAFAPGPIQNALVAAMTGAPPKFSEDCLYLNVWTPAKAPDERLPVMVWIYGGAFAMGSTNVPAYDGSRLAEQGVVIVSVAYRVGPLGFLAHPELSREGGGVSGNYGLRDQVAGLEWVRENVAAFGGDPGRVTIFGESAGGISVSMLAASPKAKGLFHRAIAQSGGSFAPPKLADEGGQNVRPLKLVEAEGERFLDDLEVADVAAARALPAADLIKLPRWWWPTFDGEVLPGDQYELYRKGEFHDTPVLIGTNSDEGALFVRPGRSTTPEAFAALVRAGYGEHAEAILAAYPHATPDEAFRATKGLFRDAAFAWHVWTWARLQAEKGAGPAFVYYFDHRTPRSPDGASHAAEIPYVFRNLGNLGIVADFLSGDPRPEDRAASDLMSAYWVQFAKAGDPNRDGLPAWPAFTAAAPQVMTFDAAPSARPVPNLPQLEALDAYYAWRREKVKGGRP